jgi:hypothetical protein
MPFFLAVLPCLEDEGMGSPLRIPDDWITLTNALDTDVKYLRPYPPVSNPSRPLKSEPGKETMVATIKAPFFFELGSVGLGGPVNVGGYALEVDDEDVDEVSNISEG